MSKPLTIINDGTKSNEDRLGTLGDIQYTLDNYEITDDVLILGGDNLFTDSLENLLQTFERGSVIGLHDVGDLGLAQLFGNVTLDSNQKVIQFVEKPKNPSSTLISTLVWALRKDHLPLIKQTIQAGKNDHAGDLIAHICHDEDIYGIELE